MTDDIVVYSGDPKYPSYAEGFTRRERRRLGIKGADWVMARTPGRRYTAYRLRLEKWYLRTGTVRAECYIDERRLIWPKDEHNMELIAQECLLHLDAAKQHHMSAGARD